MWQDSKLWSIWSRLSDGLIECVTLSLEDCFGSRSQSESILPRFLTWMHARCLARGIYGRCHASDQLLFHRLSRLITQVITAYPGGSNTAIEQA